MLSAFVRLFFFLSVLHARSSQDHSSFIQGTKMPTSLGKKENPDQKTQHHQQKKCQTNKQNTQWTESTEKAVYIKAQLGTARNSFQALWYFGSRCLEECRLQGTRGKINIPALCCIHLTTLRKYLLFQSRFVSPHGQNTVPLHLGKPCSSFPVTHRSLSSPCSCCKSCTSEGAVQIQRLLPPVSLTRSCI